MDINLILSAQTLCLAPQIKRSELQNGLIVLKNVDPRPPVPRPRRVL